MNKILRISIRPYILAVITLMNVGCTTPAPTYQYHDTQSPSAELSFESDYVLHTHFSVNIVDAEKNACNDYKTAGYLLYADSIFLYDKANKTLKVTVPANKEISISGLHRFGDPGQQQHCGPVVRSFTPSDNAKYVIRFTNSGSQTGKATVYDISRLGNPDIDPARQNDWVGSSGALYCGITVTRVEPDGTSATIPTNARSSCL